MTTARAGKFDFHDFANITWKPHWYIRIFSHQTNPSALSNKRKQLAFVSTKNRFTRYWIRKEVNSVKPSKVSFAPAEVSKTRTLIFLSHVEFIIPDTMEGVTSYEAAAAVFASYKRPQQQQIPKILTPSKKRHSPTAAAAPLHENNAVPSQNTAKLDLKINPETPETVDKHTPNERLQRR